MTPKPAELLDVQNLPDTRGVALQKVGVKNVDMPLQILQKDGHTQQVAAKVTMSVNLTQEAKGTHLSRFIIQLAEHAGNTAFCYNLREFLEDTCKRLGSEEAYIKISFPYFTQKAAPVTKMTAPVAHQCSFEAEVKTDGTYHFHLGLEVPIATLCPCSKAISDYGAHNQRAMIRANLKLDTHTEHQVIWIEDLLAALDECASCPVYPILKRADEKYVTERAYDNPKFVEDVMRECVITLQDFSAITGYTLEVEALESIHGHNAWAYQVKD